MVEFLLGASLLSELLFICIMLSLPSSHCTSFSSFTLFILMNFFKAVEYYTCFLLFCLQYDVQMFHWACVGKTNIISYCVIYRRQQQYILPTNWHTVEISRIFNYSKVMTYPLYRKILLSFPRPLPFLLLWTIISCLNVNEHFKHQKTIKRRSTVGAVNG